MSKDKLDEIEKKKRELQDELDRIQDELDHSIDEVRTEVSSKLQLSEIIKRYPLPIVGASILLGYLAGHKNRKPARYGSDESDGGLFSSVLWKEFKKVATRKAISFATGYIDSLLDDKRETPASKTNGSVDKEE